MRSIDSDSSKAGQTAADAESSDGVSIAQAVAWAQHQIATGNLDQAESMCLSVLGELAPVHALLGSILASRGDFARSIALFATAAALKPDAANIQLALSRAHYRTRQWLEALHAAEAAVSLEPGNVLALCAQGAALLRLGGIERAIDCYRRATDVDPTLVDAWNGLGVASVKSGRFAEAVTTFQKVIELSPQQPGEWVNLATSFLEQGAHAKGRAALERALEIAPDDLAANANALLFTNTAPEECPDVAFEKHRTWGARLAARAEVHVRPYKNSPDPERLLRIGYVSPDLRGSGGVASFIEPLLAGLNRRSFEITCYSNHHVDDATTARFKLHAARWRQVEGYPIDVIAEQIRADGIDLLVDLAGYAGGGLIELFARKPAPVQITYLGYPNTTGLPTMDYRITDALADPPGESERFHTEHLRRPFSSFLCYSPTEEGPEVEPPPVDRTGFVTFGSFNNRRKITDEVLETWAAVLNAVPGSRLLIKAQALVDPVCCDAIAAKLDARGIARDRFELAPLAPSHRGHLRQYGRVDIALDTFPYNGTTTTCEALWMGVPVVTLVGSTHRSRVGLSILSNVGLPELAVRSRAGFVGCAAQLAEDRERVRTLRRDLRPMMRKSPVMDSKGFAETLSKLYRDVWRDWCRMQSARSS